MLTGLHKTINIKNKNHLSVLKNKKYKLKQINCEDEFFEDNIKSKGNKYLPWNDKDKITNYHNYIISNKLRYSHSKKRLLLLKSKEIKNDLKPIQNFFSENPFSKYSNEKIISILKNNKIKETMLKCNSNKLIKSKNIIKNDNTFLYKDKTIHVKIPTNIVMLRDTLNLNLRTIASCRLLNFNISQNYFDINRSENNTLSNERNNLRNINNNLIKNKFIKTSFNFNNKNYTIVNNRNTKHKFNKEYLYYSDTNKLISKGNITSNGKEFNKSPLKTESNFYNKICRNMNRSSNLFTLKHVNLLKDNNYTQNDFLSKTNIKYFMCKNFI